LLNDMNIVFYSIFVLFSLFLLFVITDVITIGRLFPTDYLHGLYQGIVAYLLGWTLQMLYVVALLDEEYSNVPVDVIKMIQEFPSHNSFHPIKHKRFEDITSLLKQERKVFKASDFFLAILI